MNYLTLSFLGFLAGLLVVYYLIPARYRYLVILVGSYIFYGLGHPKMLITLVGLTAVSYIGGLIIEKKKSEVAFIASFTIEILVLMVFKYTNFILGNVNTILNKLGKSSTFNIEWSVLLPVGLSFIVFQTCSYLSEVYRGKIAAEKNFLRYAAFAAFFPTVLSGPIQKARNLLPQIKEPKAFDYEQAQKGTILFAWGAFEKILVANNLSIIVSRILDDYKNHSSMEILIGACCFSLYIYADFNAYSDIARGVAKLLNIDVGRNFNNPYISKNTSEFWNRWHTSLNEWFIENLYIPLGGNRKGTVRKYRNVLVVFLVSGLWHGEQWHFVIWGLFNGVLVVIGQILKPTKTKIYEKINVSEDVESIVFLKRFVTFGLITMTWMFFRSGVMDALGICKRIMLFDFVSIFNPALLNISGTAVTTFVTAVVTIIFCVVQNYRKNEFEGYVRFKNQPFIFQCLLIAIIICMCVFGTCNVDANVDAQFLYFQF